MWKRIENLNLRFNEPLTPFRQKIVKVICHHPAHPSWGLLEIHSYHQQKGWNGVGYNYFVTFDGKVQEGRGRHVGAQTSGHNHNTLGICFQGNFELQNMTDAQVKAGAKLIAEIIRNEGLKINDVVGHKEMPGASTACPGKNFRMNDLKAAILEILNPSVKKESVKVKQNVSAYAKDAQKWVIENKISDGTRPKDIVTREEIWTMLHRLSK